MTHPTTARREHGTEGFTLVELLVAMVVAGLLAAVILQVITGQARFTDNQYARQEVQDNSRSALELVASEMRGVSTATGGILYGGIDTVRFRSPIAWGVYCGLQSGQALVLFDRTVWEAVSPSVPTTVGLALQNVDSPPAFAYTEAATMRGTPATPGPCASVGQDPAQTVLIAFGDVSGGSLGMVGKSAYLYRNVAYGDGVASSTTDRWMTREFGGTSSAGSPEPLAGPVDSIRFRYLNSANAQLPMPVVDPTQIRAVRLIVAMTAQRTPGTVSRVQVGTIDSITVALRNVR